MNKHITVSALGFMTAAAIVTLRDRQKQEKAESRRELGFYLGLSPARVRDMAEAHAKAREPLSWAFDEHGQRRDNVVPFPGPEKPLESFNEHAKGTRRPGAGTALPRPLKRPGTHTRTHTRRRAETGLVHNPKPLPFPA